jgi:hypothetical protein
MLDFFEIKEEKFSRNLNFSSTFHSYETDDFFQLSNCENDGDGFNHSFDFFFNQVNDYQKREHFYVTAIRNLLKQRNFLSLINQYDNNLIDDNFFSSELDENSSKYIIEVNEILDIEKIQTLSKIIDKLDIDLIESDLSEIFSVDIFNKKILFNSQIEE